MMMSAIIFAAYYAMILYSRQLASKERNIYEAEVVKNYISM